jgi:hypothetical protein
MSHFTLTIHTRTGHFGETVAAERDGIASILHQAAQQIGSGAAATPLKDTGGHIVGRIRIRSRHDRRPRCWVRSDTPKRPVGLSGRQGRRTSSARSDRIVMCSR